MYEDLDDAEICIECGAFLSFFEKNGASVFGCENCEKWEPNYDNPEAIALDELKLENR